MRKKQNGFTLVELLAVVLIVAILSAVALPQYRKVVEKAHVSEAQAMLRTIYDSSERLAGEFGYRSYEELVDRKGQTGYSFARMDMFDSSSLPAGCSLVSSGTELQCKNFTYKASVYAGGVPYAAAKKRLSPYQNTLILFDRDTQQLYCQEASGSSDACDVFGLDTRSGVSF
ncbi:type IV pilin protein [Candidatus Avelusimicrobium alvi]|uniref:type IV pilin protein n=1 Tax=Candidatus Avelusimicrobium alvi TaxID=3416221 RepID=UPI003D1216B9